MLGLFPAWPDTHWGVGSKEALSDISDPLQLSLLAEYGNGSEERGDGPSGNNSQGFPNSQILIAPKSGNRVGIADEMSSKNREFSTRIFPGFLKLERKDDL
ncbi:hypothetical protein JTE90_029364 [Oedothorax gibbosus]|uniref:Uncharacterized protein n=1 Tax=Oedothorax gibbosus TaxID=931172 RepID=A0AAV6VMT1_9ARAC|nr:hypothetical protein JTE90_029364 [Oedothorax gibbosus]